MQKIQKFNGMFEKQKSCCTKATIAACRGLKNLWERFVHSSVMVARGKILIANTVFSSFCEQPVFLGIFVKFLNFFWEFLQFNKPSVTTILLDQIFGIMLKKKFSSTLNKIMNLILLTMHMKNFIMVINIITMIICSLTKILSIMFN